MKTLKSILVRFLAVILACGSMGNTVFFAAEQESDVDNKVSYGIEIDNEILLHDATHISSQSYIDGDRLITEDVYELEDGTRVTDVMSVSAVAPCTANGGDDVSRYTTIEGWGTIYITARFEWYTENYISYVVCKRMSASYSLNDNVAVGLFEKNWTSEPVSIGSAKAQVQYNFYNSQNPTQYVKGYFTVTCTDEGSISDNS